MLGIPKWNLIIQDECLQSHLLAPPVWGHGPLSEPKPLHNPGTSVTITITAPGSGSSTFWCWWTFLPFVHTYFVLLLVGLGASVCATRTHSWSSSQLWSYWTCLCQALLIFCKILCEVCCEDCASAMFWDWNELLGLHWKSKSAGK